LTRWIRSYFQCVKPVRSYKCYIHGVIKALISFQSRNMQHSASPRISAALRGGIRYYAAQANPPNDAKIVKKATYGRKRLKPATTINTIYNCVSQVTKDCTASTSLHVCLHYAGLRNCKVILNN